MAYNAAGGKKGGGVFGPHEFFGWFPTLRRLENTESRDDSDALIQALKERGARDLRGR